MRDCRAVIHLAGTEPLPVSVTPPSRPAPLTLTGTPNHRRTTDPAVDRAIGALDRAGVWPEVRDRARWQQPHHLSEDEELAVVLVELVDPDHPGHALTRWIAAVLRSRPSRAPATPRPARGA